MKLLIAICCLFTSAFSFGQQRRNAYVADVKGVARQLFDIQNSHFSGPVMSYGEFMRSFEDKEVIVLENEKGKVIGYTAVKVVEHSAKGSSESVDTVLISDFYVHRDFVRKQYGSDLMQAIVELRTGPSVCA
jgi:GNAT superfamily N-acetyltransferase